jgi:hypothetical protein
MSRRDRHGNTAFAGWGRSLFGPHLPWGFAPELPAGGLLQTFRALLRACLGVVRLGGIRGLCRRQDVQRNDVLRRLRGLREAPGRLVPVRFAWTV